MDMVHRDQSYLFYQVVADDDTDLSRVGVLILLILSHKELVRIYRSSQVQGHSDVASHGKYITSSRLHAALKAWGQLVDCGIDFPCHSVCDDRHGRSGIYHGSHAYAGHAC